MRRDQQAKEHPRPLATLWFNALAYLGYRRVLVREFLLDEPSPVARPGVPIVVELLDERQLDEYNAFRKPRDRNGVGRRLAGGDQCFIARHEGRIVGACWSATSRAWSAYLSQWITLSADEAYAYDAFIAPELRGLGILPALTREMHGHYGAMGLRRVIIFVVPENTASMTSAIGYRTIGTRWSVGFGRWRRDFQRVAGQAAAPTKIEKSAGLWDRSLEKLDTQGHYLDPFLADLKKQAYVDLIERWGGVPPNGRALKTDLFEEAMGPDAFLLDLRGPRLLLGMDVSMAAATRASSRDREQRARYLVADARQLPFACASLDLIVSPSTLDHFHERADLGASLRELRRVLAPNGRLIVTLDNRQNVFDPLLRLVSRAGLVPFFMGRSYTARELQRELRAAGLEVLQTSAIVHNPRLTAVGAVAATRRIGWQPFTQLVHRAINAMQRLQDTRWGYYSGCFVAALAVPSKTR